MWPSSRADEPPIRIFLSEFRAFRHVDLWWPDDCRDWRREIERELGLALKKIPKQDNPAASWLAWAAATILMGLFFSTAFMQYLVFTAN
jgi:hypothetical protein